MGRTVPFAERHRPPVASDEAGLETPDPAAQIVGADGRPARLPRSAKCPQCGAGADQRVKSGGFGMPHETCQKCAFEFPE